MNTRIDYTLKNARWTILFSVVLLVLNFFSRSVFIDYLGSDLVGLTSVIISYIGFLNLAELGIGVAITQALYKPVFDDNKQKINDIISLIGFLFRWVGIAIAGSGFILSFFLPTIFEDSGIGLLEIFCAFFVMLFTTLLSYFSNYKQTIIIATQRSYVITKIQNSTLLLKVTLQMILLVWFNSGYISWLLIELIFGIFYALWLESYIKRHFGWLKTSFREGRLVSKRERGIFRNVRNIFSQRLASMILLQSDNIIIQNVISVVQVTYFTNYTMLIQRITQLITSTLGTSHASIGNLIASNDKHKQDLVFWQYNSLFFWIAGIVSFGFYEFINPFINLWLNDKELYSSAIIFLLSFNLFIGIIRRPNEYFLNGYGLFSDVWAAWTEMGLNLVLSIFLALNYGVIGVVIGTSVSTSATVLIWKPYFLFNRGFKNIHSLLLYWLNILKYFAIISLVGFGLNYLISSTLGEVTGWFSLIVRSFVSCSIFAITTFCLMYLTSSGMRTLTKLGIEILHSRRR